MNEVIPISNKPPQQARFWKSDDIPEDIDEKIRKIILAD